MSINFKKRELMRLTYKPKDNSIKHQHNYMVPYVLEITNKNIHASCNYYNKKEYYNVLKCNICDSFIPNSEKGNFSGWIKEEEYDKKLPLITANTNMKNPAYDFNNLYDVVVNIKK